MISGMVSLSNYSKYPCRKCHKDLQDCDFRLPQCTRCKSNSYNCDYSKTEPRAKDMSEVVLTLNRIMDQWQRSIETAVMHPPIAAKRLQQPAYSWKITSGLDGLAIETQFLSYNGLLDFIAQFRSTSDSRDGKGDHRQQVQAVKKQFPFGTIWDAWSLPKHRLPQNYPLDITKELTDELVDLYCRTPCCSAIRLPIIDTDEFMARYRNPDITKRPAKVLVYAICAMAARNAFQRHVWTKRPAYESPNYNMGKALSLAYCFAGRELLAECFDEPSMDVCQAALLLSYCSYQNGYSSVIHIYEWITYTMAQDLGLYEQGRTLTVHENMLIWSLYYFNVWCKVLQGRTTASVTPSQFYPTFAEPPTAPLKPKRGNLVKYYVQSTWAYLIRLQLHRDKVMACLEAAPQDGLAESLASLRRELLDFYANLPTIWQQCDFTKPLETEKTNTGNCYITDMEAFARSCILQVHVQYCINNILVHYPLLSPERVPNPCAFNTTEHAFRVCLESAQFITRALRTQARDCITPLVGFVFANCVYLKVFNRYASARPMAQRFLELSVEIAKSSISYKYDFELTKTLVGLIEQDVDTGLRLMENQDSDRRLHFFL